MRLQIRYYKRFDTDLLSLFEAGVPLNKYIKQAIYAYAHGEEYHLYIPRCERHDLNGPQFIHTVINLTDPASIEMMQNIKRGYRNAFCKMLLREVLVFQSLGAYFADYNGKESKYLKKERTRIAGYSQDMPGLVVASVSPSRKKLYDDIRAKYIREHADAGTEKTTAENLHSRSTEKKKENKSNMPAANRPDIRKKPEPEPVSKQKMAPQPQETAEDQLFDVFTKLMGENS